MNKKGLYITLAVAVVIAAAAYIAGSVNKNNDEVSAENSNIPAIAYSEFALEASDIQVEMPDTFSTCAVTSEFFPGLVAYVFRDTDCNANTGDAPDMQIFVVKSPSPEDVIRDKGAINFTNDPSMTVVQKTVNGKTYFTAESSNGEYLVATQVNDTVVYIQAIWLELYNDKSIIDHIITSAREL
ncbi:MAG: hypothetical protein WC495_00320 [Patescibacteria group bacterium]|jgi:hypothetical protein